MLSHAGNKFEPAPTAVPKYSYMGKFSKSSFSKLGLSPSLVIPLMEAANHSLAANTWNSYATAERHIVRAEKFAGFKLNFPFSLKATLAYVGFLISPKIEGGRGLQGSSVEKYLSALRLIHMQKGFFNPWIRPDVIKQITKGASNRDQIAKRMAGKTGKHAMTPQLMLLLKHSLGRSSMRRSRKRIVWAASTICWAAALRVHELLARNTDCFDPLTTMTAADIKVCQAKVGGKVMETLKIHLKHPKEERISAGVVLDVFETSDFMCPVKAFKDWMKDKVVCLSNLRPMFRLADGRNYTGAAFNADLRKLLEGEVDYVKTPITAHSFRRGLVTFMSKNGYSDSDCMRIGRWHSDAFKTYIDAPREIRATLAAELASKVARSLQLDS